MSNSPFIQLFDFVVLLPALYRSHMHLRTFVRTIKRLSLEHAGQQSRFSTPPKQTAGAVVFLHNPELASSYMQPEITIVLSNPLSHQFLMFRPADRVTYEADEPFSKNLDCDPSR